MVRDVTVVQTQKIELNLSLKPATHLAILYADRGDFDRNCKNRQRFSPPIDADTPGNFFSPIAATWQFNLLPGLHRGAF